MKSKTSEAKRPKYHLGWPEWWHNHGHKMQPKELDLDSRRLIIEGSAAKLTIARNSDRKDEVEWLVDWEVIQHVYCDETVRGRRIFTSQELGAAFGIESYEYLSGDYGEGLITRYGAESAEQMLYIRWKEFLNIPCPGTGNDGDPNISIFVWPETKEAVAKLLDK